MPHAQNDKGAAHLNTDNHLGGDVVMLLYEDLCITMWARETDNTMLHCRNLIYSTYGRL